MVVSLIAKMILYLFMNILKYLNKWTREKKRFIVFSSNLWLFIPNLCSMTVRNILLCNTGMQQITSDQHSVCVIIKIHFHSHHTFSSWNFLICYEKWLIIVFFLVVIFLSFLRSFLYLWWEDTNCITVRVQLSMSDDKNRRTKKNNNNYSYEKWRREIWVTTRHVTRW